MKSLNSLGLGLSLVFGCLFLALIAEIYYVLWWKKRVSNTEIEEGYSSSSGREFFYLFCWKKPSSLSSTALNPQDGHLNVNDSENQQQSNTSKDFLLKPYGEDGMETEIMRLHNLQGPPRFLFTIKEETKEDLESEDGRSRKGSRNRSLSDLLLTIETPFLTPLSSPAFFTPPLTPNDSYNHHGFNPLFESSTDVEVSGLKASPPPKFKFLKDAEEKLQRRIIEENRRKGRRSFESIAVADGNDLKPPSKVKIEEDGSYITILVSKNQDKDKEKDKHLPHHSTSSQVLPLSSSPSAIRSPKFN